MNVAFSFFGRVYSLLWECSSRSRCFAALCRTLIEDPQLKFMKPGRTPNIDKEVASLIEKMVNKRTEHKAFSALEALGCPAMPSIIWRMDDRRKLPDHSISLENKSPGAFED